MDLSNQPCAVFRPPARLRDIRLTASDIVDNAMTSADHPDLRGRRLQRVWARSLGPYAEIFLVPRAWRFSAAGVIGRMPMAMFGLGTVLLIAAVTGRYGLAGAVSAAGSLGYAIMTPQLARLVDRLGQRRVLLPVSTVFAVSTAILIATVMLRAPVWAWFVAGTVAGATMPSLGSMVRARWSVLLAGSPRLHTAYSFESVADELCFVIGPAAVTVLATQVMPAAGVGVAALLCVAGSLWFAAQRSTEPSVLGGSDPPQIPPAHGGPTQPPVPPGPPAAGGRPPGEARSPRRGIAAPSLAVLIPGYWFLGAMFVSIDLSTVAFAQHFGHKPLAGFILGAYALGSATGGLWYGSRRWRHPIHLRFAITLTITVAGVATFWALPNLIALACVIYLCGLTIAPTLIAGFSIVEAQALPGRRTEALSWLSTGIAVGVSAGSTITGFVIDSSGPRWGYALAACCGCAGLLTCIAGLRRLRPADPAA
jgi:predicted MFS family arabinose efflux permease